MARAGHATAVSVYEVSGIHARCAGRQVTAGQAEGRTTLTTSTCTVQSESRVTTGTYEGTQGTIFFTSRTIISRIITGPTGPVTQSIEGRGTVEAVNSSHSGISLHFSALDAVGEGRTCHTISLIGSRIVQRITFIATNIVRLGIIFLAVQTIGYPRVAEVTSSSGIVRYIMGIIAVITPQLASPP